MRNLATLAVALLACLGCTQADETDGKPGGGGPVGIPQAPSMVSAAVAEAKVVKVTWQDNSDNEQGFSVQRQAGSGDFREVGRTTPNVTEYRDATVSSKREYIYRVAALDDQGRAVVASEDALIDVP